MKKLVLLIAIAVIATATLRVVAKETQKNSPVPVVSKGDYTPDPNANRSDVPDKYKWNMGQIYANEKTWLNDIAKFETDMKTVLGECKGKLSSKLPECFESYVGLLTRLRTIGGWARLIYDQDQKVTKSINNNDTASKLGTEFFSDFSFMGPEMTSLGQEKVEAILRNNPSMMKYDYYFSELFRLKDHIRSEKEEMIKAMAGNVLAGPGNLHDAIEINTPWQEFVSDSVMVGNKMTAKSEKMKIQLWGTKRLDPRRWVRKNAAEAFLGSLMSMGEVWTANLKNQLEVDTFNSKTSNYNSTLEMALTNDNIPVSVYHNLIDTVTNPENLAKTLHRYVSFKKEVLGLPDFRFYDNYASMIPKYEKSISYADGNEIVAAALKPLGAEYVSNFKKFSDPANGWVDVYPNLNKYSGAYSSGIYAVHPYVLLNYADSYRDMFTVAHEFGHAAHYYNTGKNQPYLYYDVPKFLAEVASTTNENLLYLYLIKKAEQTKNYDELLYLYDSLLDNIRQTLLRQTQFAEFEMIIHDKAEKGEALDLETFNKIYADLIQKYYGPDFVLGELDGAEWMFVTHFYYTFYVYSYATSCAATTAIAKMLVEGKIKAEDYLNFLKAGSSDAPVELLKRIGVDFTTPAPVQESLDLFATYLDKFEKVWKQQKAKQAKASKNAKHR